MKINFIHNVFAEIVSDIFEEEYVMPYIKKGNTIYKNEGGHIKKVGTSKNPAKYVRTLQAVEHGFKPVKGRTKRK